MRCRFDSQLLCFLLPLVRRAALVVVFLCVAIVNLGARSDWIVLENCRLILNPANDGDSFHASAGKEEYIFRLSSGRCTGNGRDGAATADRAGETL